MLHRQGGSLEAQVLRVDKKIFTCVDQESKGIIKASCPGKLLSTAPVVGDWVEIQDGQIKKIKERKNEIYRLLQRTQKRKILAANCDYLVIVFSLSAPAYKRGLLDRYLVRAFQWEVTPLIVFNKLDEWDQTLEDWEFEVNRIHTLKANSFGVCSQNLTLPPPPFFLGGGGEALKEKLRKKVSLFVGASGVGKSSLVEAFTGHPQKAGKLARSGKGAHTTSWVEIKKFSDWSIMDSPGVRSYGLDDIDPRELIHFFPDLHQFEGRCQFRNCSHRTGAKGCFFSKLDPHSEEGAPLLSRLESFLKIHEEISRIPHWKKDF